MMSQEDMTLQALQKGELTAIDALKKFGCFRLAARIYRLRQSGHKIEKRMQRLGNGKNIAVYSLKKEST
jgi:hypothetical protein